MDSTGPIRTPKVSRKVSSPSVGLARGPRPTGNSPARAATWRVQHERRGWSGSRPTGNSPARAATPWPSIAAPRACPPSPTPPNVCDLGGGVCQRRRRLGGRDRGPDPFRGIVGAGGSRPGVGGLPDGGRGGHGGDGLRGGERNAGLSAGRDAQDGLGRAARRRDRRGGGRSSWRCPPTPAATLQFRSDADRRATGTITGAGGVAVALRARDGDRGGRCAGRPHRPAGAGAVGVRQRVGPVAADLAGDVQRGRLRRRLRRNWERPREWDSRLRRGRLSAGPLRSTEHPARPPERRRLRRASDGRRGGWRGRASGRRHADGPGGPGVDTALPTGSLLVPGDEGNRWTGWGRTSMGHFSSFGGALPLQARCGWASSAPTTLPDRPRAGGRGGSARAG